MGALEVTWRAVRIESALATMVALVVGYAPPLHASPQPVLLAQAQAPPPATKPAAAAPAALTGAVGETQTGLAAYYSQRLNGRRTASGERFNNGAMTTAHQTLPFGTKVKLTNVKNNKSIVLRVNDRGPTQPNRIVDVSRVAAQRLGFTRSGAYRGEARSGGGGQAASGEGKGTK